MRARSQQQPGPDSSPDGPRRLALGRLHASSTEEVASVAHARRELLLRVHSFRLPREDLEDCYSQATLELLVRARGGRSFASRAHIARVIEQRFISRVHDRRRALAGRSPMQATLARALSIDGADEMQLELIDQRADVEALVIRKEELRRICALAAELTPDQRLVLASQVALQMTSSEFCQLHRWSAEKYRKVAQRARSRLRDLVALEGDAVPPRAFSSEQSPGTRP